MKNKSSSSNLLVVGSVAFDSIETPFGKVNKALGGSASYFSLAASFFARPSLVGAVGNDLTDKYRTPLQKHNIDLSGMEQVDGKTFAWGGKYSFDLNNRTTLFTKLGVFKQFKPKLSQAHKSSDYVFLGNIHPALQLEVLAQINKPKLVGLDTMNLWIETAPKLLAEVLKKIDIFIINDSEAREFSGEHNLIKAAKKIMRMMEAISPRPSPHKGREKTLIIKRGEYGLLMFQQSSKKIAASPAKALAPRNDTNGLSIFHLPGYPLEDVIDPTGAGDSFAGGFMGYLCREGSRPFPTFKHLKRACVYGSVMASFCCEQMGTERLQSLLQADIKARYGKFKKMTEFELD
ncbi:MAG: PfkB family carbohydrate kinase [Candidatus Doudnabacteria bacterium]|nr:PfkB family carbohydrate kinase [Candidatus Doudnabacteria bacterium]